MNKISARALKILHIWNVAGVGSLIALSMDKLYGTKSWLLHRAGFDNYGLTKYGEIVNSRASVFYLKCLIKARNYDLIHVHSIDELIPFLKFFYDKPVIIHYHGSDVRDNWETHIRYIRRADAIIVSSEGLLDGAPANAIWIPNFIDTEHFRYRGPHFGREAFTFMYGADDEAQKIADKFNLNLDIIRRGIPYKELPDLMLQYDFYLDLKSDSQGRILPLKGVPSLSKTALEALSMGLKVIAKDQIIREGLPEQNKSETVLKIIYELYEDLLNCARAP